MSMLSQLEGYIVRYDTAMTEILEETVSGKGSHPMEWEEVHRHVHHARELRWRWAVRGCVFKH